MSQKSNTLIDSFQSYWSSKNLTFRFDIRILTCTLNFCVFNWKKTFLLPHNFIFCFNLIWLCSSDDSKTLLADFGKLELSWALAMAVHVKLKVWSLKFCVLNWGKIILFPYKSIYPNPELLFFLAPPTDQPKAVMAHLGMFRCGWERLATPN